MEKSGPELALESTLRKNFEFFVILWGTIIYQNDPLVMLILKKHIRKIFDHHIREPESSLYPQFDTSGKKVPKKFL
jgi:hypothetical protein